MALTTSNVQCCHCGGALRYLMFLPIARRGHFFQDSFFSNIHQDFNTAVKRVLEGWADTDLQLPGFDLNHTDILDRYRQLRSRNLKEENQAVTVASDNTNHKMVVDVHDFTGGDVKVKMVGEKELVVEGRVEKSADGGSSVSTHTFRRSFILPNHTDVNAISSAMSSDGILTITAPKLETSGPSTTVIPIQMEEGSSTPKLQQQFSCESCYSTAPREYRVPIKLENAAPDNTQSKTTTVPIHQDQSGSAAETPGWYQTNMGTPAPTSAGAVPTSPPAASATYVVEEPMSPPVTTEVGPQTVGSAGAHQTTDAAQPGALGQPNVFHASPVKVVPGDLSTKSRSFVPEGTEAADPQGLYKTRGTGVFPIKIHGSVINSNAL